MSVLSVILFIISIISLFAEIFIPSFGILTILGISSLIGSFSITINYLNYPYLIISAQLLVLSVIIFATLKYFKANEVKDKLILNETLNVDSIENIDYASLSKIEGICVTPLKPFGYAKFDNNVFEVYSTGKYIDSNSKVKIIKVNDLERKIYVEKVI